MTHNIDRALTYGVGAAIRCYYAWEIPKMEGSASNRHDVPEVVVRVRVGTHKDAVVISTGKHVVALTPSGARDLARSIFAKAEQIDGLRT